MDELETVWASEAAHGGDSVRRSPTLVLPIPSSRPGYAAEDPAMLPRASSMSPIQRKDAWRRQTLEEADGNNERTNLGFGRSLKRAWASSFRSIRSAPQLEGKREGDGGLYERDQLGGPVPGPHSRPASLEPSEWGSERSEWEFSGTERDTTKSDRLGPRAMFSAEYPAAAYSTGWS
jgi:hypothetical protein